MYRLVFVYGFFFFKQKTAYEMRISDWSSDVCSSDLPGSHRRRPRTVLPLKRQISDILPPQPLQGGLRSISRRAMRQSLQLARASRFTGLSINPAETLRAPNSNGSFNPIELRARRTADILSGTIKRLAHHTTERKS